MPSKASLRRSGKSLRKQAFWRSETPYIERRKSDCPEGSEKQLDLFEKLDMLAAPRVSAVTDRRLP